MCTENSGDTLHQPPHRPWDECPCCRSTQNRQDYDFSVSMNPLAVPGRVVSCLSCGLQFKIPSKPDLPLEAYYQDASHYQFQDDVTEAEKEFGQVLKVIAGRMPAGSTLLDVGAGAGHFLRAAVRAGYVATGVELNPDLAKLATESSGANVIAGDALALPRLLAGRERSFSVVALLDLIEHVQDPVLLLKDAASFVAPGGILLVYTPNHKGLIVRTAQILYLLSLGLAVGPLRGIYDCDHVTFFDPRSLRETARRAGLVPGPMSMLPFNPSRRGVAKGITAVMLRAIEAFSPWCCGEFRMLLVVQPDELSH